MALNYQGLLSQIKSEKIKAVYYFFGDEYYLIDLALKELQKVCLGEGPADFNLDIFYQGDSPLQQVLDVAETLPMFSPKRLVVIKNINDFKAKDQDLLGSYLEKDIDTTCLVMVGKKPDLRKKVFSRLNKDSSVVEFASPTYRDIPQWIDKIASSYNKKMDRSAKDYICQMVGNSLSHIDIELKKISQFVGESKLEISKEDVAQVVTKHRLESVFDLTTSIGSLDRMKSLYYLAHLLDQGESEIGILALISRHIRILNLVKEGQREGLSSQQLASRAGVPPFYVNQYTEQAKLWDIDRLDQVHKALVLTDKALKSSPVSSPIWLENFILKSCDPNF